MLLREKQTPPQLDLPTFRTYCRNPKCRGKLKIPVESERDAFCCRGCFTAFYRRRCLVCEQLFDRKTENQRICRRAKCRSEFRRDRAHFLGGRYPSGPLADICPKSARKMGVYKPPFSGRPWRQVAGPDLGPNFLAAVVPDGPNCQWKGGEFERLEAQNRAALQAHFVKLAMPPANLLGGYRFSGASTAAEFGLIKIEPGKSASIDLINRPDLIIPADLSIPEFTQAHGSSGFRDHAAGEARRPATAPVQSRRRSTAYRGSARREARGADADIIAPTRSASRSAPDGRRIATGGCAQEAEGGRANRTEETGTLSEMKGPQRLHLSDLNTALSARRRPNNIATNADTSLSGAVNSTSARNDHSGAGANAGVSFLLRKEKPNEQ